ncbi:uncharacterized protein LOC111789626 [Cucurbita pepo subsp. pepo]|uniref:uncharacterized protein LOC111789626 n=1 Tax=Cucurbita pepo subsp. pepo TaxID=3664 RepID=UPI000C9D68C2|nr:uncharacterized protein LOC111789626 [Cucurbita pepo subsp. pepo]
MEKRGRKAENKIGKENQRMAEAAAEEMELISLAIRRLMEENTNRTASHRSYGGDDLQFLSRLLSQVESTREQGRRKHSQQDDKIIQKNVTEKEIVKEIKEVKRQNFITHCLVSATVVLTVAWQVSEVSFILKLRDGLSNPFKNLARILKRNTTSAIQHKIEATELPALPHVNLPDFHLNDHKIQ